MKGLIKIEVNENQEPVVNGRELYQALGIDSNYTTWFNRMCDYGFSEGIDLLPILEKSTGGRPEVNHAIKLDMAKEIAMIQRNEKGKEVRQYFIQVEKEFNSPEKIMARALKIAENKLNVLQLENAEQKKVIEEQKPKVLFADSVETAKTSILIGEFAKILKQNGVDIGQNRLFDWLRNNNYLIKTGERRNTPTQTAMDLGLFEIKERTLNNPDGSVRITRTTKLTGKGQVYFVDKFLKEVN